MKRFSLNFSDQKIESEYNQLKELTNAKDYNITLFFLFLYLLTVTIPHAVKNAWISFEVGVATLLGLVVLRVLFRYSLRIQRSINFLSLLVIFAGFFSRFYIFADVFDTFSGGEMFLSGTTTATLECILILRFLKFNQQFLGVLITFALKIGVIGSLDHSVLSPHVILRHIILDGFMIYTFYAFDKRERLVFLSFFEYREGMTKFKQLLSDHLPQSLTVMDLDASHSIYSNNTFTTTFEVPSKDAQILTEAKLLETQLEPSHSQQPSKISLDSLEIDMKTVREITSTQSATTADFSSRNWNLKDLVKQIAKNISIVENTWTFCASYTHAGSRKLFDIILKKIKWDKHDVIAMIFNDITYQENLISLKVADENKNQVLGTVAHELRTPLSVIIGIIQMTEKKVFGQPEVLENLALCKDNAYMLLSLVNSILDFQQIEQGKLKLNPAKINVRKLMHDIKQLFQFQAKKNDLSFKVDVDHYVPEFIVNDEGRIKQILINLIGNAFKFTFEGGVTLKVSQDLANSQWLRLSVIDTGVGIKPGDKDKLFKKYGKLEDKEGYNKTGVGLGLAIANSLSAVLAGKTDGRGIDLESETGVGSQFSFHILKDLKSLEKRKRVPENGFDAIQELQENSKINSQSCTVENTSEGEFEEFLPFATSSIHTPKSTLIKKSHLAESRDGEKEPMSMTDIHKAVRFVNSSKHDMEIFKAKPHDINFRSQSVSEDSSLKKQLSKDHEPTQPSFSSNAILVVDDNPFNLLVAESLLNELGYDTKTARGGKEAIEIVKNYSRADRHFRVILMDCQMPVMDGYETTKILKGLMKENKIKKTPIIALTANMSQKDIDKCYESGMDEFLSKPLVKRKLAETIGKLG